MNEEHVKDLVSKCISQKGHTAHEPYPLFTPTPATAFYEPFIRPVMSEAKVRALLKLVADRMYDYGFASGIQANDAIEQQFVLTDLLRVPVEINPEPIRRAKKYRPDGFLAI